MAETGYTIPTLAELVNRISGDLASRLPGRDTRLRRTIVWALAIVLAGASYTLWRFLAWIVRQIFPGTADGDRLVRFADVWGMAPTEATYAAGRVAFPATNGAQIPIDAIAQRGDGAQYRVTLGGTGSGGSVTVTVKALDAGAGGNCAPGTVLALTSPITGVNSAGAVADAPNAITDGVDAELVEDLRVRLLAELARPPQGGAVADYDKWTREIANVARVFVQPRALGPGTVRVFFTVKGAGIAQLPDDPKVAEVQAHLDKLAPVTATPTAAAPTFVPIAMTIHVNPDSSAIRAAIEAELEDLFDRESEPSGTIPNSHFHGAIDRAEGEDSHTIGDIGGGGGSANVTNGATEIAYLGVITWS